jgi:hypothetical protein
MKYYRIIRKSIHTETIIVKAGNKSDAKQIAEDDLDDKHIFVEHEHDSEYEVYYPDIMEDSALNCAKKFNRKNKK